MCAEYHLLITNKMVELRSNNLIQMFHYIVMLTHCGCSYATATTSAHKHCTKLKDVQNTNNIQKKYREATSRMCYYLVHKYIHSKTEKSKWIVY